MAQAKSKLDKAREAAIKARKKADDEAKKAKAAADRAATEADEATEAAKAAGIEAENAAKAEEEADAADKELKAAEAAEKKSKAESLKKDAKTAIDAAEKAIDDSDKKAKEAEEAKAKEDEAEAEAKAQQEQDAKDEAAKDEEARKAKEKEAADKKAKADAAANDSPTDGGALDKLNDQVEESISNAPEPIDHEDLPEDPVKLKTIITRLQQDYETQHAELEVLRAEVPRITRLADKAAGLERRLNAIKPTAPGWKEVNNSALPGSGPMYVMKPDESKGVGVLLLALTDKDGAVTQLTETYGAIVLKEGGVHSIRLQNIR